MYYYKLYYDDGTYDLHRSTKPLYNPRKDICATCHTAKIMKPCAFWWEWAKEFWFNFQ